MIIIITSMIIIIAITMVIQMIFFGIHKMCMRACVCVTAQADLHLRWAHMSEVRFLNLRLVNKPLSNCVDVQNNNFCVLF